MADCAFVTTEQAGKFTHHCPSCNVPIPTPFLPFAERSQRYVRDCQASASQQLAVISSCVHRGPQLREQLCPTCAGKVRLKVFACAMHQECTILKPIGGMACCPCEKFA